MKQKGKRKYGRKVKRIGASVDYIFGLQTLNTHTRQRHIEGK